MAWLECKKGGLQSIKFPSIRVDRVAFTQQSTTEVRVDCKEYSTLKIANGTIRYGSLTIYAFVGSTSTTIVNVSALEGETQEISNVTEDISAYETLRILLITKETDNGSNISGVELL